MMTWRKYVDASFRAHDSHLKSLTKMAQDQERMNEALTNQVIDLLNRVSPLEKKVKQ